jgi:hypothetical protein
MAPTLAELRRGWYLGSRGFRERMFSLLEVAGEKFKREREVNGAVRRSHGGDEAERILRAGLEIVRIPSEGLALLPKGDMRKLTLAALIRQRKSVSNAWITRTLNLGHVSRVSHCRIEGPDRLALAKQVIQPLELIARFTDCQIT